MAEISKIKIINGTIYDLKDGRIPAMTGSTTTFLRGDGTWATPTVEVMGANATVTDDGTYMLIEPSSSPGISLQDKTNIAPTLSSQTITADVGYDGLNSVQINAIPSGTAGTPIATKGTVSNHSINVTPSVTNTTGYIVGDTKTGTPVSVSASELVSGSETKTSNGTYDVTNLAELVVDVTSKNIQYSVGRYEVSNTNYTATNLSITVNKTGTYKCYWSMDRNTTSGTSGSQLYNGSTALGSAHTTWTYNNNARSGMNCEETLTLEKNSTITVRARSRSTSYICGVMNFFIVEQ